MNESYSCYIPDIGMANFECRLSAVKGVSWIYLLSFQFYNKQDN